jgi:aminoglycoside 6'-N-acetyltransferase I
MKLSLALYFPARFCSPPQTRHFDRSSSRLCELRSGEIRFSTSTYPPRPLSAHKNQSPPSKEKGDQALTIKVRQAHRSDQDQLAGMRALLWPEASLEEHRKELESILRSRMNGTLPMAVLVSQREDGALTGFIEVGLRSHADGCNPARPVGFVEGWFVHEARRKQGIGSALMRSAEAWARNQGCLEMASDTWIDDETSLRSHQALGFEVVDRCVHFRKPL